MQAKILLVAEAPEASKRLKRQPARTPQKLVFFCTNYWNAVPT